MHQLSQETSLKETGFSECEKEPIHIPNRIQSHGALIVLTEPELTIVQVSDNTLSMIGIAPDNLLQARLSDFLLPEELLFFRHSIHSTALSMVNPLRLSLNGRFFDWILHRHDGFLLLEIEPLPAEHENVVALYGKLSLEAVAAIKGVNTLDELTQVATEKVRELTGFDRVMLYRFDEHFNGQVIAEARNPEVDSFLHLFFPASDIPSQARALYALNFTRYIPDVDYRSAHIVPLLNPVTRKPLDMSYASLRGVSPFHIEYLKNMGVKASMSFAVIIDNKLWGLFACHHYSARHISYIHRLVCEQTASMFINEMSEHASSRQYEARLRRSQDAVANAWRNQLPPEPADLLGMVNAEGAAICRNGEVQLFGHTPSPGEVRQLLDLLHQHPNTILVPGGVFATSNLSRIFSQAAPIKTTASGLMMIPLSSKPGEYLLWFRPEVVVKATWGGNPEKAITRDENTVRVSPRKSFEAWKKDVVNTSSAWQPVEVQMARKLKDIFFAEN